MQRDICEQIDGRGEVLRQRSHGKRRRVHGTADPERCAKLRDLISDLQRVPRRRALVQHRGGEVGESGFVERVRIAAGTKHEVGGDDRKPAPLAQDQGQPIGKRLRHRRSQLQRTGGRRLRHLIAPRFVDIDRFTAFALRRLGRRRRGHLRLRCRLARHHVHHDTRRRRELIARKRLQRRRIHGAIALDVLL